MFVYIVYVCVIECIFLFEKKNYLLCRSFWWFLCNMEYIVEFLKKMVYKDVKYYCIIFYKMLGFF